MFWFLNKEMNETFKKCVDTQSRNKAVAREVSYYCVQAPTQLTSILYVFGTNKGYIGTHLVHFIPKVLMVFSRIQTLSIYTHKCS